MKSIIKKSLVIALVYYVMAIIGCVKCKCQNAENKEFKYREMMVQNVGYYFTAGKAFTVSDLNVDTSANTQYGISVRLSYDLAYQALQRGTFGMMNSAYACDCNTGFAFTQDPFESLSIITQNDLDDTHPAGSNINEYFKIVSTNENGTLTYYDLNYGTKNGLFSIDWNGQSNKDLYFSNPKAVNKVVACEIKIKSKTGKIYSAITKPVFLK